MLFCWKALRSLNGRNSTNTTRIHVAAAIAPKEYESMNVRESLVRPGAQRIERHVKPLENYY